MIESSTPDIPDEQACPNSVSYTHLGVTQAYCAYAKKHEFDTIDTIDILDCNGGDHGYAFATNFNPEVNLREVSAPGSYIENGKWVEIPAMSIKREYNFDSVGEKDMYLLHHEELESLAVNIPEVKRIRFFMTFGQSYLTHMKCLENVGKMCIRDSRLIPPPVSAPVRASAQPRSATKASGWKRTARIRIKIWKISPYLTAAI